METGILDENKNADFHPADDKSASDKEMEMSEDLDKKPDAACMLDESAASILDTKDIPNPQRESTTVSKQKNRKKSDCNVQHVLRALNSLTTPEEKLAAMCQKYADMFDENRKLRSSVKQFEKQVATIVKERDQTRSELSKSILSRSRLENLCRELQRQNKEIKEESFQKIQEEEEKRKEVSAKFQTTLNEITELMKEDNDKTMKLRDDNIDMTSKLKSIYEQYGIREQQIEKMAKQMALEAQLYEARLAKLEMETSSEKEHLLREKQQLLVTLTEYQAKFQENQNIEVALRNQVALYNSKYEEFEKSLTRSNKMFSGFKEEMESMSYKIVKLESETLDWKQRWEKTQKALVEMAAEKQKSDQEVIMAAKQMATLHKLCRTLHVERAQLLNKLKELGSEADTAKFETALENVFTDSPKSTTSANGVIENTDASLENKGNEPVQQPSTHKFNQKKPKREKTSQKVDRLSTENSCEPLTDTVIDNQPSLNTSIPNPELESSVNAELNIAASSPSNENINGEVNSTLPETNESITQKTELAVLQKDPESDIVLQKSTRCSKSNKNSPKKKNKK